MNLSRTCLPLLAGMVLIFGGTYELAAHPTSVDTVQVLEGYYASGFEQSRFTPCASVYNQESWWLSADSASWEQLHDSTHRVGKQERAHTGFRAFVRVRATITSKGQYGHLGGYDRKIYVHEVLEAEPAQSGQCNFAARAEKSL